MKNPAAQMPLRLSPQQLYRLDNFYFSQPELAEAITVFCEQNTQRFLYLWGQPSSGKTHLSLAIADKAQRNNKSALYLPLAELVNTASPEVLQGLENQQLVCLDELEAICAKPEWEQALFHCFNQLQDAGCQLLLTSRYNPASIELTLPDLRSRIATGLIYQLNVASDMGKQKIMQLQSKARGFDMPDEVAQYLLRHHSRDLIELMHCLHALDKASMVAQRRLTIPFVKQILQYGQN